VLGTFLKGEWGDRGEGSEVLMTRCKWGGPVLKKGVRLECVSRGRDTEVREARRHFW